MLKFSLNMSRKQRDRSLSVTLGALAMLLVGTAGPAFAQSAPALTLAGSIPMPGGLGQEAASATYSTPSPSVS
jgi:hypothetical protein